MYYVLCGMFSLEILVHTSLNHGRIDAVIRIAALESGAFKVLGPWTRDIVTAGHRILDETRRPELLSSM